MMVTSTSTVVPGTIGSSYVLRLLLAPQRALTDLVTIAVLFAVPNRGWILNGITTQFFAWVTPKFIYKVLATALCLILYSLFNGRSTRGQDTSAKTSRKLKPLLFPCRTTHTRLFPKIHSFSYSYLYAGIPIGWAGASGTLLSADTLTLKRSGHSKTASTTWFSVEAEDYLRRGSHKDGLLGKLREFLETQDIDPDLYPHAYLVTAPRFLGFSFNPVSFWYLYTPDQKLGAMILEVNNTFDERRMYFMGLADKHDTTLDQAQPFKHSWPKDFHVSPFNSRDGSYSVTATDPFAPNMQGLGHVDVNLVLQADEGKPKLIARVFSTGPPTVTDQASRLKSLLFVFRWWWVGFMTNPRIIREARKLWSKGLQVFYRPEVLLSSIGRQSTAGEEAIERQFAALLDARASELSIPVHYTSAAGPDSGVIQRLGVTGGENTKPPLTLHVLSPAFYTEVVRLDSSFQVIEKFGMEASESERLVHISDIKTCERLFDETKAATTYRQSSLPWSPLWWLLMLFRASNTSSMRSALTAPMSKDRNSRQISELDLYVVVQGKDSREYLKASLAILLGDRIAFGYPPLLKSYGFILWLTACWFASYSLEKMTWVAELSRHAPLGKAAIATMALHCLAFVY